METPSIVLLPFGTAEYQAWPGRMLVRLVSMATGRNRPKTDGNGHHHGAETKMIDGGSRLPPAVERMRHYRERRRRGLLCIKVQLWRREVDALVAWGLVQPAEREDRRALAAALHRYLDINPIGGHRE
jgi:hypothetical protein